MEGKRWNQIAVRLSVLVSVTLFGAFGALGTVFYHYSARVVEDEITYNMEHTVATSMEFLDSYFEEIEAFSLLPIKEENFPMYARQEENMYARSYIENKLKLMFYSRNDLYSIDYVNAYNGSFYEVNRRGVDVFYTKRPELLDGTAFTESIKRPDYCFYSFEIPPAFTGEENRKNQKMFGYSRVFINIKNKKPYGMITISPDASWWKSHIEDVLAPAGEPVLLLDGNENLAWSNTALFADMPQETFLSAVRGFCKEGGSLAAGGELYKAAAHKSERSGFTLVKLAPVSFFTNRLMKLRNTMWMMAFVIGIGVVVFNVFMAHRLTLPLRRLTDHIKTMEESRLTKFEWNGKCTQEVWLLKLYFNSMVERINDLVIREYQALLNEKTAVLNALENQLNPHFLTNVLQAISTSVMVGEQKQASGMLVALGRLIEYSFQENTFVTVEKELKNVQQYCLLIQGRFKERFCWEISMGRETAACMIPKLSVQNLAENVVKHVLEKGSGCVKMKITSWKEGEVLHLLVEDNGPGIEEMRIREIAEPSVGPGGRKHTGLANLQKRLRILYEDKAGLLIRNTENGTNIEIVVGEEKQYEPADHR